MLPSFSVKKPLTVIIAVCLVIVLGVISFTNLSTDLLPSMNFPYVVLYTTYAGASPEKVETALTKPMESAIATLSGVSEVRSISAENVSMIVIEYTEETDVDSAMIELSSRVDMVTAQLEDTVGSPVFMKINPDMIPIAAISVSVDNMGGADLSRFVNNNIMPSLERVDGVAQVNAVGMTEEYISIQLSSRKIGRINHHILAAVDEELARVETELNKGWDELDSGREQLDAQTEGGEAQIERARIKIAAAKQRINAALAELKLRERETKETLVTLTEQKQQIEMLIDGVNNLSALNASIQVAEGAINALDAVIAETEQGLAALYTRLAELEAELAALPEGEEYDAERERLEMEIANLNKAISSAVSAIDSLNSQREILVSKYNELVAQRDAIVAALESMGNPSAAELSEMLVQINAGIEVCEAGLETIAETRAELEATLTELNNQEASLNAGQIQLIVSSAEAEQALAEAEAELVAAQEQFELARDEALKKADIGGTITADMIANLLTAENFSLPAGYVCRDEDRLAVKVGEPFASIDEVKNLELITIEEADIGTITLEDVADVAILDSSDEVYARLNDSDGLLMTLQKQSEYSTTGVSRNLREAIEEINETVEGAHVVMLMDQGVYIDIVIGTVIENLLYGAVLAIVILFLFLRSARSTLIVGVSIPISLMLAIVLMYFSNVNLNVLSLAGLALGVGMLVDNSIVTIENIYRLRQRGTSVMRAAVEGAKQITGPIIASTLTTICVFLPIAFTQGLTKELFGDMGLTIAFSLISSLLVALTLVPAMSSTILKDKEQKESKLHKKVTEIYGKILAWCLDRKWVPLGLAVILFAVSIFAALNMGSEFIPDSDFSEIMVTMTAEEGTTQEEQRHAAEEFMNRLLNIESVKTVGLMEGGGTMSLSTGESSMYSMYVVLEENRKVTSMTVSQEIVDAAEDLPFTVSARNTLSNLTSYLGSGIDLYVQGDDLSELSRICDELAAGLETIEGVYNVKTSLSETSDELKITVDKNKAMKYMLTVAQVYQQLAEKLQSTVDASNITIDENEYAVTVSKDRDMLPTDENILNLELTSGNSDEKVLLGDIATLSTQDGYASIERSNYIRVCEITAEVDADHNIGIVGNQVNEFIAEYDMPDGYSVSEMGENKLITDMLSDFGLMIVLAIVLIYAIMVAQFQSFLSPFIIMVTMPLAFTGALLMLWICGFNISIIAAVGMLVLVGIVVNNGIVFIDFTVKLRQEGKSRHEALIEAGKNRLRPIMMTTLTTILGLMTLLFGVGTGADMLQPMAVVVVGGLSYATILTLIVVPVLYDMICKRQPRNASAMLQKEKQQEKEVAYEI
ncbi:MAG: efflux RND transporter permease subunit [Clostridiales bacterium]|nr:efflux RND transporter permease subunit [Clostridiales bacterium]MDD7551229.1 efflux RND transporter permease subunit [Clostridia bacterium]